MRKVIGVTGSIGSGKTTFCRKIKESGYTVIDCDKISHDIILKNNIGYKKVLEAFGDSILDSSLEIDRKKLASIIFNKESDRLLLNSILHPLIYNEVEKLINNSTDELIFMDCPLLFETNFKNLCDYTVVIYVDMDNQIWRIMNRDKIDFPHALKKIYAQMTLVEKINLADYVIDNCHQEGDLDWQLKQLILKIERGL